MISAVSGEVDFSDGLRFGPHEVFDPEQFDAESQRTVMAGLGWSQHLLGRHPSEYGSFEVEVVSDRVRRIHLVLISHVHSFYESGTTGDAERRAFHEGVLGSDLHGQREFSWGQVFCRLDRQANQDWIVVAYTLGPPVPLQPAASPRQLSEQEPGPGDFLAERLPPE